MISASWKQKDPCLEVHQGIFLSEENEIHDERFVCIDIHAFNSAIQQATSKAWAASSMMTTSKVVSRSCRERAPVRVVKMTVESLITSATACCCRWRSSLPRARSSLRISPLDRRSFAFKSLLFRACWTAGSQKNVNYGSSCLCLQTNIKVRIQMMECSAQTTRAPSINYLHFLKPFLYLPTRFTTTEIWKQQRLSS